MLDISKKQKEFGTLIWRCIEKKNCYGLSISCLPLLIFWLSLLSLQWSFLWMLYLILGMRNGICWISRRWLRILLQHQQQARIFHGRCVGLDMTLWNLYMNRKNVNDDDGWMCTRQGVRMQNCTIWASESKNHAFDTENFFRFFLLIKYMYSWRAQNRFQNFQIFFLNLFFLNLKLKISIFFYDRRRK